MAACLGMRGWVRASSGILLTTSMACCEMASLSQPMTQPSSSACRSMSSMRLTLQASTRSAGGGLLWGQRILVFFWLIGMSEFLS